MPKVTKYPRLRSHVRKGRNGQVYTYWYYDMRPEGKSDIPLGKDYAEAIGRWDELHNKKPRIKGTLEEAFSRWEAEKLPDYQSAETRLGYTKNLKRLRPVFGAATWDQVKLTHLVAYLEKRTAKVQGNREMSLLSVIWNQARKWGLTEIPWPAHGMARSEWKNKEKAREFEVTDALFDAVYAEADGVLRDAMDIATATGMRLTDVRTVRVPVDNILTHKASKTGKRIAIDVRESPTLLALLERRGTVDCVMLLCTKTGRQVSARMLRERYEDARARAAEKAKASGEKELAESIRKMILRDMRKRSANLAGDLTEASKLLQHSNPALTLAHYRTRAEKVKPVR